nr:hypothetical protein [uncultured Clostridium sp.]
MLLPVLIFISDQMVNAETSSNIRGYTVSVFVPVKENEITPIRYLTASEGEDQSGSEASD